MPQRQLTTFLFLLLLVGRVIAAEENRLLPPKQAFQASIGTINSSRVEINWKVAKGYSLYKRNMRFSGTEAAFDQAIFPAGQIKHDELLGDIEHYRNGFKVDLPVTLAPQTGVDTLTIRYQGCADIGICYPPQEIQLPLKFPANYIGAAVSPLDSLVKGVKDKLTPEELLPPDEAFQASATADGPESIRVSWQIAKGYYLYKEKTKIQLIGKAKNKLGEYTIRSGIPKEDEAFGKVEIFYDELNVDVPVIRTDRTPELITLELSYQGCADRGVCYPPMTKEVTVELPSAITESVSAVPPGLTDLSEQDQIVHSLKHDGFLANLLGFFGLGVLLSFTPCIFPMIPILSGIIVGKSKSITTARAFFLSLSYVVASALTYTLFGILAALFGSNLQTTFQQPWIIVAFSAIFVLLSLSMFGFYSLDLPDFIRAKLHNSSEKHRDGSITGAAIMGALSSLIVGPCVAAPLAGALIYIGQTGDAVLGGSALFTMGMGMGLPLLLIGASAGKLLPQSGGWLNATKYVFGVIMLAVAVWMLSRILPASITMLLWSLLLIIPAIYLNAIDPLPENSSGWLKLWKGLGLTMLAYGLLLLIGLSMGNSNPLQPLAGGIGQAAAQKKDTGLVFERIKSVAELDARIAQAASRNQPVMLDYYADWCISCKEMEAYTFTNAEVKKAVAGFMLLQADVTENSTDDKALLAKFELIGPPATLFFNGSEEEIKTLRVVGFQDAQTFLKTLVRVKP
jgi:thioredoxin:protein disulfide reductase